MHDGVPAGRFLSKNTTYEENDGVLKRVSTGVHASGAQAAKENM